MALYGITNANQIIDVQAIKSACGQIDSAAEDFKLAANKIEDGKGYMGGDAMRVDGKTMEESCELVKGALENIQKNINEYTSSIIETANAIYVAQSQELADYQAKQAEANANNNQ